MRVSLAFKFSKNIQNFYSADAHAGFACSLYAENVSTVPERQNAYVWQA
jgi:hypothetical protein